MIRKYIYNRGQNEKKKEIFTKWCQAFPAVYANWSSQKLWLITSSIFAASPCKAIALFFSINLLSSDKSDQMILHFELSHTHTLSPNHSYDEVHLNVADLIKTRFDYKKFYCDAFLGISCLLLTFSNFFLLRFSFFLFLYSVTGWLLPVADHFQINSISFVAKVWSHVFARIFPIIFFTVTMLRHSPWKQQSIIYIRELKTYEDISYISFCEYLCAQTLVSFTFLSQKSKLQFQRSLGR